MSTPQPTRPAPRTQREREEERRRKEQQQPDEQPSQPRKPEVELPKDDDGVTEEKWNRTPRR